MGGGQCGAQGEQYQAVHDLPNIDLCEYHDYSPAQPMPGDQWNGLQVRLDQCAALDKPLFVGEAGIIPNQVGGTLADRAAALLAKLEAQSAAGVQGFLSWAWNNDGVGDPASFDIGPGDPLLDVLMVNRPPMATDDVATVPAGAATDLQLAANDTDDDLDALTTRVATQPSNGSVTCAGDECTYTPNAEYVGPDTFTYVVADGKGGTDVGDVGIEVAAAPQVSEVSRISLSDAGAEANGMSSTPAISNDGRIIVFSSDASNLVPGDTNNIADVFARDRITGEVRRVSVSSSGQQQTGSPCLFTDVSPDGRYVVFTSGATNLVPGVANFACHTYIHDLVTGTTEHVSRSTSGNVANGSSAHTWPAVSEGGRYVVFSSSASNLVSGDTNSRLDTFLRDRELGTTTLVSVATDGSFGNGESGGGGISDDGRYVAFSSTATNLVANDTNGLQGDIFVRDLQAGTTEVASLSSSGAQGTGTGCCSAHWISGNGRFVAFASTRALVPGDTNGTWDIFVRDRQAGTTIRGSVSSTGAQANDASDDMRISYDGRYLTYHSYATNLVEADTNGESDVFRTDLETGTTIRVSESTDGAQGNSASAGTSISGDGRFIAFSAGASNLVPGDTNAQWDVFLFDAAPGTPPGDTTPPTVTIDSPGDGAVYATDELVLAEYRCDDEPDGSGIASCDGDVPNGEVVDTSSPGSYSFVVTGTDLAGNTTVVTHFYDVEDVPPDDMTPPVIDLTTPADGATYTVGDVVIVDFACTDEDGGSGIVDCSGDIDDGEALFLVPGTYSFTVAAEDGAGNFAEVMHIFEVVAPPDADGDGLLDAWETEGIDADGNGTIDLALDQPPYNADPNRKDIFVEIDSMSCAAGGCVAGDTHSHAPDALGLEDVTIAFADAPVENPDGSTGIDLHLMTDDVMPHSALVSFISGMPGPFDDFDDYKLGSAADPCDGYFGAAAQRSSPNCEATLLAWRRVVHYAIYGHSYTEASLSSGIAEIRGNDFMVTLGGDPEAWIDASGTLREAEAGTLMHELGHNLGLHHGGADAVNCKPNYLSVMNYTLQVPYMDPTRPLDYSRVENLTLDESALTETNGIGFDDDLEGRWVIHGVDGADTYSEITSTGEIDWNGNGDFEAFLTEADVNWLDVIGDCGESFGDDLAGHDDWSNLVYNFRAFPDFAHGSRGTAVDLVAEELPSDVAVEVAETVDFDGDGVPNADDSCPAASDPNQADMDGDGVNDACDDENLARIDILPGIKPNTIPKGLKLIPVAILSTPTFDATKSVDRASLTFGKTGSERSLLLCLPSLDVNRDRKRDVVCIFNRGGLVRGDTVGVLRGKTTAGAPFVGRDTVVIKK